MGGFNTMSSEILTTLDVIPKNLWRYITFYYKVFGYWRKGYFQNFIIDSILSYDTTYEPQHPNVILRDKVGNRMRTQLKLSRYNNYNTKPFVLEAKEYQVIKVACTYSTYRKPSDNIENFEICCTGGYTPSVVKTISGVDNFNLEDSEAILTPEVIVYGVRNRKDTPVVGFCIKDNIDESDRQLILKRLDIYNRTVEDIYEVVESERVFFQ